MTKFQVRPKSEKECEVVQRAMFALGYSWRRGNDDLHVMPDILNWTIFAHSEGKMDVGPVVWGDYKTREYPVAKAEKIIAEAMRRLSKEYYKKGWSVQVACDLARSQLGIDQVHSEKYIHKGGVISVEKPVDISAMLKKNPSTSISREGEAAIETLKAHGYTYHGGTRWKPPLGDVKSVTPFWMVIGPGPATTRHDFEDDAHKEAKRLSQKHPGTMFYVVSVDSAYCAESPTPELYVRGEPHPIPF